jgi:hypothetical protein
VSPYIYPTEIPTMGTEVFSFDCTQDEDHTAPAKATEYAVDTGFTYSDGVTIGAKKWRMTGIVTATPLGGLLGISWDKPNGLGRITRAYDSLVKLRDARQPVCLALRFATVVGYLTTVSMKAAKDMGGSAEITIEAEEVRRAVPSFGSIPASRLAPSVSPQTAKNAAGGAGKKPPRSGLAAIDDASGGRLSGALK